MKKYAEPINATFTYGSFAGARRLPVRVIGETPTRYRIEADFTIRLQGRGRVLERGQSALVPKHAIRFHGSSP